MKVACNRCCRFFDVVFQKEIRTIDGDKITKTLFCCPYCGEQYVVSYNNKDTKKLENIIKRQIKRIGEKYKFIETVEEEKQYKEEMFALKQRKKRWKMSQNMLEKKWRKEENGRNK